MGYQGLDLIIGVIHRSIHRFTACLGEGGCAEVLPRWRKGIIRAHLWRLSCPGLPVLLLSFLPHGLWLSEVSSLTHHITVAVLFGLNLGHSNGAS